MSKQKLRIALALGALAAVAAFAVFAARTRPVSVHPAQAAHQDRKVAPEFTLEDANGASVKLSDYRGKVVLLNFWATWCGPCALEIPWFKEFEQAYKSKGFEVLGVSMDDDGWKAVKPYLSEHNINYRVVLGNDSVSQLYGGVDSLPTTFVLDREGKVAFVHVGLAGKNDYLNEIQTLLGVRPAGSESAALPAVPAALFGGSAK